MNPNDGFIWFQRFHRISVPIHGWMFFVTAGYAWPCHIANQDNQQTREAGQSIPDMLIAIGATHVQIPAL